MYILLESIDYKSCTNPAYEYCFILQDSPNQSKFMFYSDKFLNVKKNKAIPIDVFFRYFKKRIKLSYHG